MDRKAPRYKKGDIKTVGIWEDGQERGAENVEAMKAEGILKAATEGDLMALSNIRARLLRGPVLE